MSERTVRVNGVCLTESQVREAYAELERGDATAIESQVCVTEYEGNLYLSVPTESVRKIAERAVGAQRVVQVRLHAESYAWYAYDVRDTGDRLVLTWPEIVRRLTGGV